MSVYNLIEYNRNYSETTGSLWFYAKDEATNFYTDNNAFLNLLNLRLNYQKIQLKMEQIDF